MSQKNFVACDRILDYLEVERLAPQQVRLVLEITNNHKNHLKSRTHFFTRVAERLGQTEVELMRDLL